MRPRSQFQYGRATRPARSPSAHAGTLPLQSPLFITAKARRSRLLCAGRSISSPPAATNCDTRTTSHDNTTRSLRADSSRPICTNYGTTQQPVTVYIIRRIPLLLDRHHLPCHEQRVRRTNHRSQPLHLPDTPSSLPAPTPVHLGLMKDRDASSISSDSSRSAATSSGKSQAPTGLPAPLPISHLTS